MISIYIKNILLKLNLMITWNKQTLNLW